MLASQEVLTEADRTFLTELQETVRSATDEEQFSQIVTLMQSAKHEQFRDWLSEHTHSINECGAKFEMTGVHTVVLVMDKAA